MDRDLDLEKIVAKANDGDVSSMIKLALHHECCYRVEDKEQNYEAAKYWYYMAANTFDVRGMMALANFLFDEHNERAYVWLKLAAEKDCIDAMRMLALIFDEGLSFKEDEAKAIYYYELAISKGDIISKSYLASAYREGNYAIKKNYDKAFKLYYDLATSDLEKVRELDSKNNNSLLLETEAYYDVAKCYEMGLGVTKDLKKALEWYNKAYQVEQEDFIALAIGNILEEQNKLEEAYNWYLKEASLDKESFCNLEIARLYEKGIYVKQDYKEAFKWYYSHNDSIISNYAKYKIAYYIENGLGTKQDYKEAMKRYLELASLDEVNSMKQISHMYEEGLGVSKDHDKAMEWKEKALEIEEELD